MSISLKEFQTQAVYDILNAIENGDTEVILQAPTGSGKTLILVNFLHEFTALHSEYAFVWLSIGKGELAEQSRGKMVNEFPLSKSGTLREVLTGGFYPNLVTFINWEKITKKGNIAISEGERENLQDKIEKALRAGIKFILIIDEQHLNDTFKATEMKRLFNPVCEIYASATPKNTRGKTLIKIDEGTVIEAGLIKKRIFVNEGLASGFVIDDKNINTFDILLDLALAKRRAMRDEYAKIGAKVNPLICVQLPNNTKDDPSNVLVQNLVNYFADKGVSVDTDSLSIWLSGQHENLEGISQNTAQPIALIFKQAIATGWDCPRATILVKLRENMDEIFEVQTIGRIRRMPEAKHYENELLDNCYIYTFDKGFIEGLSKDIYGGNLINLKLKTEHTKFTLTREFNPDIKYPIDPTRVREVVADYFIEAYGAKPKDYKGNVIQFETNGYTFNPNVIISTVSGSASTLHGLNEVDKIVGGEVASTHKHGYAFLKSVSDIGATVSLLRQDTLTVLRSLFRDLSKKQKFSKNLFHFQESKMMYAFVINNRVKLKEDFQKALNSNYWQQTVKTDINTADWNIPRECEIAIDDSITRFDIYHKNVYDGYLSSVARRSDPEKKFEKWCEKNESVLWFYKNGETSRMFFSIIRVDSFGKQRHFYPDYIVMSKSGKVWILETKGGQSSSGTQQDLDLATANKFEFLIKYIQKYKTTTYEGEEHTLGGGFVRYDSGINELLINTTVYNEDLSNTEVWVEIDKVIQ